MVRYEILITGRGGQGILLAGYILGLALVKWANAYVVHSESYSAETRGGDTRSELVIADSEEEIGYIRVRRADIAVFMYKDQAVRYSGKVSDDALVIADEVLVPSDLLDELGRRWRKVLIPFTKIAEERIGNKRVANMVMLGSLSAVTGIVSPDALKKAVRETVGPAWVDINLKAIDEGYLEGSRVKRP